MGDVRDHACIRVYVYVLHGSTEVNFGKRSYY